MGKAVRSNARPLYDGDTVGPLELRNKPLAFRPHPVPFSGHPVIRQNGKYVLGAYIEEDE